MVTATSGGGMWVDSNATPGSFRWFPRCCGRSSGRSPTSPPAAAGPNRSSSRPGSPVRRQRLKSSVTVLVGFSDVLGKAMVVKPSVVFAAPQAHTSNWQSLELRPAPQMSSSGPSIAAEDWFPQAVAEVTHAPSAAAKGRMHPVAARAVVAVEANVVRRARDARRPRFARAPAHAGIVGAGAVRVRRAAKRSNEGNNTLTGLICRFDETELRECAPARPLGQPLPRNAGPGCD